MDRHDESVPTNVPVLSSLGAPTTDTSPSNPCSPTTLSIASVWCRCGHRNSKRAKVCAQCPLSLRESHQAVNGLLLTSIGTGCQPPHNEGQAALRENIPERSTSPSCEKGEMARKLLLAEKVSETYAVKSNKLGSNPPGVTPDELRASMSRSSMKAELVKAELKATAAAWPSEQLAKDSAHSTPVELVNEGQAALRENSPERSTSPSPPAWLSEQCGGVLCVAAVPDDMDDFAEMDDLSCHRELAGPSRCAPESIEAGFPSWSVDTKFDMHLGSPARSPEWGRARCQELNRALKLNGRRSARERVNDPDCYECIIAANEPTGLTANRRQMEELLTLSSQVRECTQLLSDADEERTMLQTQVHDMNMRLAEVQEEAESRTDELVVLQTELTTLQQRYSNLEYEAFEQEAGQTLDDSTTTDDATVGASGDVTEVDEMPVTAAHRYQAKSKDIEIVPNETMASGDVTEQARHDKMKDQVRQELLRRVKTKGQWSCFEASRQWAARSA